MCVQKTINLFKKFVEISGYMYTIKIYEGISSLFKLIISSELVQLINIFYDEIEKILECLNISYSILLQCAVNSISIILSSTFIKHMKRVRGWTNKCNQR